MRGIGIVTGGSVAALSLLVLGTCAARPPRGRGRCQPHVCRPNHRPADMRLRGGPPPGTCAGESR